LRWSTFSPFVADDGQRVPLEIFVGRREDARAIATTPKFARLFSGRKLGKSALLSFIRSTYDGHALPGGLSLRVVYVPAAGLGSEAALVRQVLQTLKQDLNFTPQNLEADNPADRLMEALSRWRQERSSESLLIVLDEADVFVEEQLREFAKVKEACL